MALPGPYWTRPIVSPIDDLHEEICQEALMLVLKAGAAGLAKYGGGKKLFRRKVLAAIRVVRANNAPPGERTRYTAQPLATPVVAAEDIGKVPTPREVERCSVAEANGVVIDFDKFPDRDALQAFRQVEFENDVDALLKMASRPMALALRQIHLDDIPLEAVAAMASMSRFTLNRRIKAFTTFVRAAA